MQPREFVCAVKLVEHVYVHCNWFACGQEIPQIHDLLPALCGPAFAPLGPLPGVGDLVGSGQVSDGSEEMKGDMEGEGDERCMGLWGRKPLGVCQ